MSEQRPHAWWRDAVIYEVYIRSFADSNGDGIGDLPGITGRLPYLADLGVDALWITPFYRSPMTDGGYDVADYRAVDPIFGSLEDFDALIARAHGLGLRVIIDIVPNHTSAAHPWFVDALRADPGSAVRNRYVFRPGRGRDGAVPPTDWESVFGGPAWTRVVNDGGTPGEWYLHMFDAAQPDLNWTNPQVREEFASILMFWLDHGVDGFRVDVAHGLVKDPLFPDVGPSAHTQLLEATESRPYFDQPAVHEIYREWRKILDSYPGERIAVAEAWVPAPVRLARYVRPDELHQAFNFEFLKTAWNAAGMRSVIDASVAATSAVGAPTTWVLSNHDVVRHVTRYGDGAVGVNRARAAALLMLALPGSAYVYQGEELGLPEVLDLPNEVLQDPVWQRSGYTNRGRDGCRVPLPWEGDEPPFGFTSSTGEPWLPIPVTWWDRTAQAQRHDGDSMLTLYRTALRLRREHPALGDGSFTWVDGGNDVLVFEREPAFVCLINMGVQPTTLAGSYQILCASGPIEHTQDGVTVPADTAAWLATA